VIVSHRRRPARSWCGVSVVIAPVKRASGVQPCCCVRVGRRRSCCWSAGHGDVLRLYRSGSHDETRLHNADPIVAVARRSRRRRDASAPRRLKTPRWAGRHNTRNTSLRTLRLARLLHEGPLTTNRGAAPGAVDLFSSGPVFARLGPLGERRSAPLSVRRLGHAVAGSHPASRSPATISEGGRCQT
jgi:hypothetical protein